MHSEPALDREDRVKPRGINSRAVLPIVQVGEILEVMGRQGACKVAIDFRDTALPR